MIPHPIREPRLMALVMMLKRSCGAFRVSSNLSVTPPVKSSIASLGKPVVRFSYDPFNLFNNRQHRHQEVGLSTVLCGCNVPFHLQIFCTGNTATDKHVCIFPISSAT